ncbi:serine protease [Burkholderia sp. 572]|uniref:S1 family peptidase n=1 Tax=Burkholderia sp. 572 TaxID=3156414 RepID=UPI0033918118
MLRQFAQSIAGLTGMLMRLDRQKHAALGLGSAFICHRAGYILTCAHSFNLTDSLGIYFPFGPQNAFVPLSQRAMNLLDVEVKQFDATRDLALLKVKANLDITMPDDIFLEEDHLLIGASVAYAGFPFSGQSLHVRHLGASIVSAKVLSESGTKQFQLDATIHGGTSGGPLVDIATNKVVGVVSGRFSPIRQGGVQIFGIDPSGDTAIGFGTSISYGIDLMRAEGLDVR